MVEGVAELKSSMVLPSAPAPMKGLKRLSSNIIEARAGAGLVAIVAPHRALARRSGHTGLPIFDSSIMRTFISP
jgi:hypothetical protein